MCQTDSDRRVQPPYYADIEGVAAQHPQDEIPEQKSTWRTVVAMFGLPCIIGVAAIDPGNLEVDLKAGAALGYTLIWSLLLASVLGWILQTLAAHVAIYTGLHLAEICQRVYSRDVTLSRLVFGINLLSVIAFDVAEVIGTAVATRLLLGLPLWLGMILSVLDTMLVLHLQKNSMTRVELVIEGLLFILAACLVYEFALAGPSWPDIFKGAVIPSFGKERNSGGVLLAISIMGSVIMSHNLFLHSWLEKERRKTRQLEQEQLSQQQQQLPVSAVTSTDYEESPQHFDSALPPTDLSVEPAPAPAPQPEQEHYNSIIPPNILTSPITKLFPDCRYATVESAAIFFSTFLINTCVLVVAATLPSAILNSVGGDIGLKDAGALLRRVFGQQFASTAWGVALLASGHAATVTGVLASQAVCEGFLQVRDGQSSSRVVLASRLIAIIPALIVALLAGESGSDDLAVASQAILSFALPFAAIPLFKVLAAISKVHPLYSRSFLYSGYMVFSIVMVANVMAIMEFAQVVAEVGIWASITLWMVTAAILVFFIKLLITPVRLKDIDAKFVSQNPDELSQLLTTN